MQLQKILAWAMLAYGIVYALVLCRDIFRRRAEMGEEKGTFGALAVSQAVVYFFTTMGFPDFILNTLLFQKCGWVEDKRLPSTLVASCVLPATVISFSYLSGGEALDAATVILCMLAVAAGSFCGARVMARLDGKTIRLIMGIAMICSMGALVVKMIAAADAVGTATGLSVPQLCIALPILLFLGFINMFGVPMKAPAVALFLLLGMTPMSSLTLMIATGAVSPMAGGVRVLRSGLYQNRISLAAVSFGTLGALAGTAFTVSLDATTLSVILLVIMAITAVTMLRPARSGAKEG